MVVYTYMVGFLLYLLEFCTAVSSQTINETHAFYQTLMQGYDKRVRPVLEQSDLLSISVAFELTSIQDFDDLSGLLQVTTSLNMEWTDPRFKWNPSNYSNIASIVMPHEEIWMPDLVMLNAPDQHYLPGTNAHSVRIHADGLVSFQSFDFLKMTCSVDVKDYPYDTQSCTITILPWGYLPDEVSFVIQRRTKYRSNIVSDFMESSAWFVSAPTVRLIRSNAYSGLQVTMSFTRRYSYVIANLIIPVFVLSCLNTWVFWLPPESGERISFSITVFLSFAVYMTILSDHMPKGSEPLAKMNYQMISMMSYSVSILFCTIISLRMYNNTGKKDVPNYIRKIVTIFRCKKLCNNRTSTHAVNGEKSIIKGINSSLSRLHGGMHGELINAQYQHVNNQRTTPLARQGSKQLQPVREDEAAGDDTMPEVSEPSTCMSWMEVGHMFDIFAFILHTVFWLAQVIWQCMISVQDDSITAIND